MTCWRRTRRLRRARPFHYVCFPRNFLRWLRTVCLALLCFSATALADISYTGSLAADDGMFSVDFTLAGAADITLRTWSFAGGTNAAGDVIPAGGFAPVLSLFDSSGNLLAFDDGGVAPSACGARNIDPATGFCLDAYIAVSFPPEPIRQYSQNGTTPRTGQPWRTVSSSKETAISRAVRSC